MAIEFLLLRKCQVALVNNLRFTIYVAFAQMLILLSTTFIPFRISLLFISQFSGIWAFWQQTAIYFLILSFPSAFIHRLMLWAWNLTVSVILSLIWSLQDFLANEVSSLANLYQSLFILLVYLITLVTYLKFFNYLDSRLYLLSFSS